MDLVQLVVQNTNKPGTTKVGAISKAQKAQQFLNCKKWDLLGTLKIQYVAKYEKKMKKMKKEFEKKTKTENFGQCYNAEKCKRGALWNFLTSILLQIIETTEGGTL